MDGLGTNNNTILDILIGKSNAQRQTLKAKYKEMYRKVSGIQSWCTVDASVLLLSDKFDFVVYIIIAYL